MRNFKLFVLERWTPDPADFFQEGARIEAAFRKYFHRAEPSQENTSVDILVCHGNVIRYCTCRALQTDPRGWLRMAVHNGSITVFIIKPSGRVTLLELGGAGHFNPDMLTFNWCQKKMMQECSRVAHSLFNQSARLSRQTVRLSSSSPCFCSHV